MQHRASLSRALRWAHYRSKRTVIRVPAVTCDPAGGDWSRATPLPTASRSKLLSSASSTAARNCFPRKEGTAMPPCSTSKTTVPLTRLPDSDAGELAYPLAVTAAAGENGDEV